MRFLNKHLASLAIASLAALLPSAPANAAPTLSGSYALTEYLFCQIQAKVDSGTGQITIGKQDAGSASFAISTISFDSNASTYALNGTAAAQSAIFEKFSDGSHHGIHAQHYPVSDSGSYSNTDTTLTLNGHTYDVVYSRAVNGIAEGFTALYQGQKGDTCIIHLLAQTQ